MCGIGGSAPSAPTPPPTPAPPPTQPEAPNASRQSRVEKDPDKERRRRAAMGQQGTILTGSRGLMDGGESGGKTLLGG